jgi:transcriptional regulator with XRE-family HTH domain
MSEYGETLARYLREAGLNQRELGAAIGLDSTQVNKIIRGRRPPLGAKYMEPLVRALRLSRSEAEKLADLADLPRKVLDFMDEVAANQAVKSEQQAISTPMPTMGHPALTLPDSLLIITFGQIEAIFKSKHFSEEQMKSAATELLESAKQIARLIKPEPEK